MSRNVEINQLSEAIHEELTLYSADILQMIDETAKKHMDSLVEKTRATAPTGKRKKHYKKKITSKKLEASFKSASYLWYVKAPDYRLSHLLNNGHAKKNGGRVEGTGFITKAHDEVLEAYENDVERGIRNG